MTATAVRPEVVKLLASVDVAALGEDSLPAAFHTLHHYDGRPVTASEAKQIATSTLAENAAALGLVHAMTEAHVARAEDAQRLCDLTAHYGDGRPDITIGDVLNVMTAAERAEAEAILGRLNDPQDAYLGQFRHAVAELG